MTFEKIIFIIISAIIVMNNSSYILALPFDDNDIKNNKYSEINVDHKNGQSEINWTSSNEVILGNSFDKMYGVKALDKSGDNLMDKLVVNGDVDTPKAGKYKIEYSFTDSDKN